MAEDAATSFFDGDVVNTLYGVGVIVGTTDDSYKVRLNRIPGKSIGSSALAFLQGSALLGKLPAAPGMITVMNDSSSPEATSRMTVMVQTYYASQNLFLVSPILEESSVEDSSSRHASARSSSILSRRSSRSNSIVSVSEDALSSTQTEELVFVPPEQLQPAPSAKFYPVLETLMERADQTVSATTNLLQNETTQRIVDSAGKLIQNKTQELTGTQADKKLQDIASKVEDAAPQMDESAKQVLELMKNEELTVLLEQGKQRLERLVTDIPEATQKALEKTGIHVQSQDAGSILAESAQASRRAALEALEQLLQQSELDPADLAQARDEITTNFTAAFDALATAAKSDRGLNEIFESITEQTAIWQEQTGRLLQTRSASLFLEGASRLQARAAAIWNQNQFQWAGEIGSQLTKSFTEGDAALAKLKSIELGDAVKDRLIDAIEVRSESVGGLDGIIAGALSSVRTRSDGRNWNDMLTNLQRTANQKMMDTHETLIAVLSSRSLYRDVALLRLERVMCDLEDQFGDDLTPDAIAALARGQGGTAQLFEPIARRALAQIEHQLDAAETQVSDPTVLEVLKRIRKIMSGELSLSALMDELVDVLNDERIVAAGETLVQHSEHVLDVIEGASGNQAVTDAIQIAEKAGITKDSLMRELKKLDVNDLLDTAGSAVTDERARQKLLSLATDVALDFVLRIIPSMPVPPFEGVKDGLVYFISNLSLEGFRVRKEDIQIEIAGMRATKKRRDSTIITTNDAKESTGFSSGTDNNNDNAEIQLTTSMESSESSDTLEFEEVHTSVKATELVIIDIRHVSAILDNAIWSFEQTYMPYLKGKGMANVRMSDGAIRLQFELRRRRKENSDGDNQEDAWEPVLCLHDRSCSIGEVDLSLQGEGKLTWILNKLASIFKGPLRDYVVRTIVNVLTNRSGWILERLNMILSPYWELILRTAKLRLEDLVEADDAVVVKETVSKNQNFVELVWRERLPLGMNLLMNDESGLLKVVDFPRGSQARSVCEKRQLDPDVFKGAQIVAVNGSEYDDQEELFDALKDPSRPKTVRFELAAAIDAERVRKFVAGSSKEEEEKEAEPFTDEAIDTSNRTFETCTVVFDEPGELGIEFGTALDNVGLVVSGMLEGQDGIVLAAERSGRVLVGDLLTHVNDELAIRTDGTGRSHALKLLEMAASHWPLSLTFSEPYLHREVIEKPPDLPGVESSSGGNGPTEIVLGERQSTNGVRRIVINGFVDVDGVVESSSILIGDHLVFVNGNPVGLGAKWLGETVSSSLEEVYTMLKDESFYPIGLTFARPRQKEGSWGTNFSSTKLLSDDECNTFCVTASTEEELGCVFDLEHGGDVVVRDFCAVPGMFQTRLRKYGKGLSIDSLNGQFVPSYASKDMVRNALNRSWKTDNHVEIWLCDDDRKRWIHSMASTEGGENDL